ncbi:hypothetical protein J2T14_004225 [Paenibacillus harenae]|nr:hypothetical protein [Paenibacillus harenae]
MYLKETPSLTRPILGLTPEYDSTPFFMQAWLGFTACSVN